MSRTGTPEPVDPTALTDALQAAANRYGRLSDEQIRALRRRRQAGVTMAASATGALALAFLSAEWLKPTPTAPAAWQRTLATRAGERGTLKLADGSTVRLSGATRVQVIYAGGRRSARLLAGQAFFDVAHDSARPFTVRARATETRVLGTAFDLDLTQRQVSLSVYRGKVGFDPLGPTAKPRGVVVRAGYRSSISAGKATTPTPFDPDLPDWRQGWIDTAGMRLDDLARMLDRQGNVRIATPAEPLASTKVFGRFRTDNPRQLLGATGEAFGFTVVNSGDRLTLRPAD
jgi:transmembrane sensor